MKIYAVVEVDGDLEILTWSSMKAFEQTESYVDPRFLRVITRKALIEGYSEPYEDCGVYFISPGRTEEVHNLFYNLLQVKS